jgi:hypothetical protein
MDFRVSGRHLSLDQNQIVDRLQGVTPRTVQVHSVIIDGTEFPIKQAFAVTSGMDLLDFTTDQARRVFVRLGFIVQRRQ